MSRLTPEQMDILTQPIAELYRYLESETFRMIAKMLKAEGVVSIRRWQIEQLNAIREIDNETLRILNELSEVAIPEIRRMIYEVGTNAINDVDRVLIPVIGSIRPIRDYNAILQSFFEQTFLNIENFVNQTLITTQHGKGMTTRIFETIINQTTAQFIAGGVTLDQALERTILSWADRGVPSIFIDRGGSTWSLERYVDMVLRSSLNRTYNHLRMSRMEDYGVFTAQMTEVPDPHDRCIEVQGTIVDTRPIYQATSGYRSIYEFGYGTPQGTLGINCRHSLIPHIPGVNIEREPQYQNRNEMQKKYQQRERQRLLERRIRKTKVNAMIQEELGSENLARSRQTLRRQQGELRDHLRATDHLSRVPSRERVITPSGLILQQSQ